jgi:pentose-5-phosphate-3-epimerase
MSDLSLKVDIHFAVFNPRPWFETVLGASVSAVRIKAEADRGRRTHRLMKKLQFLSSVMSTARCW